jgi:hypothetical protein
MFTSTLDGMGPESRPAELDHSWWYRTLPLVAGAIEVPWIFLLYFHQARVVPTSDVHHLRLMWCGLDAMEVAALVGTAIGVRRRAPWLPTVSATAATLLLCDAWFNTVTTTGWQLVAAGVMGVIEVSLAALCYRISLRSARAVSPVLREDRSKENRSKAVAPPN